MTISVEQLISELEKRYRPGSVISLFLDFDGTLVPIADDPRVPELDSAVREVLRVLTRKPCFLTTIISGRAVEDLYGRIRVDGLIYAGNHGLEIFSRRLSFVQPAAAALRDKLALLTERLERDLRSIDGALVEYKGLTTSVHYRHVSPPEITVVQDVVRRAVDTAGLFRINLGRKVVEIVPQTDWHKGAAARWILRQLETEDKVPIFFGDDSTDEDAFATLTEAITVKVGGCPTRAKYRVSGPDEVHEFLRWLADFEPHDTGASACGVLRGLGLGPI